MTHTSSESKFHLDGFLPLPLTCLRCSISLDQSGLGRHIREGSTLYYQGV